MAGFAQITQTTSAELWCLPPDGPQGPCQVLRQRLTLLMHHLLPLDPEALSFQPGPLRPFHVAHPEVCSCERDGCDTRLKNRLSSVITEASATLLTLHCDPEFVLALGSLTPQLSHALRVTMDLLLIILPQ